MRTETLAMLIILGATAPAIAQSADRSNTKGFMLGFALNGTSIKVEDDDNTEQGGGATLQLGYGFNRSFTGFIDLSGVTLEGDQGDSDVTLAQVFLGGRFNIGTSDKRWIPFLDVGLGARILEQKDVQFCNPGCTTSDVSFSGPAFFLGGGLSFYMTRSLALTGGLHWGVGEFSDVKVDNVTVSGFETDATTARFNLGITWYPKG
jgi:hypothetical protein